MTTLTVNFVDPGGRPVPSGPFALQYAAISAAIQQSFAAWTSHLDVAYGAVTLFVRIDSAPPSGPAQGAGGFALVIGRSGSTGVSVTNTVMTIATGRTNSVSGYPARLGMDPGWVSRVFTDPVANAAEIRQAMLQGIGGVLGASSRISTATGAVVPATLYGTSFDQYVQAAGPGRAVFTGPYAEAAYGPVPLDFAAPRRPAVPGGVSVLSSVLPATTIQPLDIAILRDTLLPILSDQEVAEHAVTRLYLAAMGRLADGPGLLAFSRAVLSGASLGLVAQAVMDSPEYIRVHGVGASDLDWVGSLYRIALHRPGDAAGVQSWVGALASGASRADVLQAFADSAEDRVNLNAAPNFYYDETAEAEVERMYDAAFGRAPDPVGFANWTGALLNGATLQQVAMGFMTASTEFASRYGAAPDDKTLVDAFYQNTLHRAADAPGEAAYLNALAKGLGRADLLAAFSEAGEHQRNVTAADTAGFFKLDDPSAHLGSIPVLPPVLIA